MSNALALGALIALAGIGVLVYLERRDLLPEWVSLFAGGLLLAGVAVVGFVLRQATRAPSRRPDAPQTPWGAQERAEVDAAKEALAEEREVLAAVAETTDPDVRSDALSDLLNRRGR